MQRRGKHSLCMFSEASIASISIASAILGQSPAELQVISNMACLSNGGGQTAGERGLNVKFSSSPGCQHHKLWIGSHAAGPTLVYPFTCS